MPPFRSGLLFLIRHSPQPSQERKSPFLAGNSVSPPPPLDGIDSTEWLEVEREEGRGGKGPEKTSRLDDDRPLLQMERERERDYISAESCFAWKAFIGKKSTSLYTKYSRYSLNERTVSLKFAYFLQNKKQCCFFY